MIKHAVQFLGSFLFMVSMVGCNLTSSQEPCGGARPECACAVVCVDGQWTCSCEPEDMTVDLDMSVDLVDQTPDVVSDMDMTRDMLPDQPDQSTEFTFDTCLASNATTLPNGSKALNLGAVDGKVNSDGDKWCLTSDGKGFKDDSDEAFFVHNSWNNDFDFRVRLIDQRLFGPSAQMGIMVRKNETPSSAYAMVGFQGAGKYQFSYRSKNGFLTTRYLVDHSDTGPRWLRLTRKGQWVVGLVSTDGQTWKAIGQRFVIGLGSTAQVGFALSGDNQESSVFLDNVGLMTFNDAQCPSRAYCPRVDLDGAEALRGGLDISNFETGRSFSVTTDAPSGAGSFAQALADAKTRTDAGGYAIIRVSPNLSGKVVTLSRSTAIIENTWIQGNGLIIQGAEQEPPSYISCDKSASCMQPPVGLSVGSHSIIQGLVIRHFDTCLDLRSLGSGVWIHNNTIGYCSNVYVNMSGNSRGTKRHISLSYNRFVGAQDKRSYLVQVATCDIKDANCNDNASNTYVAMHHNHVTAEAESWFPSGGGKFLMYNNYLVSPYGSSFGDLMGTGEVWSANNVFEHQGAIRSKTAYKDGTVQSVDDVFIGDIVLGLPNARVSYTPPYPILKHGSKDTVIYDVTQYAGVNP